MNTVFLLMAEFEKTTLSLEEVAPRYFGLNDINKAKRMAAKNELPIAFFKATGSNKCPWHCHVQDLANLIDTKRKAANDEFIRSNS
jgi:hypothetical protein